MTDNIRTYVRTGMVDTYLEIAVDSFLDYQMNKKEFDLIVSDGFWHEGSFIYNRMDDYFDYNRKLRKDTIKVIVFLTTFLDVYIYDLGGITLGDNYTKEHLDKLSILSKWVVIPRLLTGKEIDKSKAFYSDFKDLIKFRNYLVHHKTKDATYIFDPNSKKGKMEFKSLYEIVDLKRFFKMLVELFEELDRIDEKGYHSQRIRSLLENCNINAT